MTPWTVACWAPPWSSPGKNTGVGGHSFLQGIFPTQGLSPRFLHLLHWQVDSSLLCHVGSHICLSVSVYLCLSLGFCFHYCHSCCITVQDPDRGVGLRLKFSDLRGLLRQDRAGTCVGQDSVNGTGWARPASTLEGPRRTSGECLYPW